MISIVVIVASLPMIGATAATGDDGYLITTSAGEIGAFGLDNPASSPGGSDVVSIVAADGGQAIWLLEARGTVRYSGLGTVAAPISTADWEPGERAVSLVADPDGTGHWIITTAGRVHSFGAVATVAGVTHLNLAAPIVDASATPDGAGLYLLGADGGIFTRGTARFFGSIPQVLPGVTLDKPVVGIVATAAGYWLIAADGGIFAFGDAQFRGSLPEVLKGQPADAPVVGAVSFGNGYLMVGADGGVFNFSNRAFAGSWGGTNVGDVVDITPA